MAKDVATKPTTPTQTIYVSDRFTLRTFRDIDEVLNTVQTDAEMLTCSCFSLPCISGTDSISSGTVTVELTLRLFV